MDIVWIPFVASRLESSHGPLFNTKDRFQTDAYLMAP